MREAGPSGSPAVSPGLFPVHPVWPRWGKCKVNTAPPPGASATETEPSRRRMIRRTMDKPSPAPDVSRAPLQNRSKIFSRISGRHAGTGIDDRDRRFVANLEPHRLAARGLQQCVLDQVVQRVEQHPGVAAHHHRRDLLVDLEAPPPAIASGPSEVAASTATARKSTCSPKSIVAASRRAARSSGLNDFASSYPGPVAAGARPFGPARCRYSPAARLGACAA